MAPHAAIPTHTQQDIPLAAPPLPRPDKRDQRPRPQGLLAGPSGHAAMCARSWDGTRDGAWAMGPTSPRHHSRRLAPARPGPGHLAGARQQRRLLPRDSCNARERPSSTDRSRGTCEFSRHLECCGFTSDAWCLGRLDAGNPAAVLPTAPWRRGHRLPTVRDAGMEPGEPE